MAVPSDIAFTPAVKAVQTRKGSRQAYERWEIARGMQDRVTPDLAAFVAGQRSLYLATVNADGQPYIQHRGGPPGFLRVVDGKTLGFADFRGNRQYVSLGNLSENPKACMFLMDYAHRRRIKIWGRARMVEDDPALVEALLLAGYSAKAEQALLFSIEAWDANCPQHIPQLLAAEDVLAEIEARDAHIRALEAELAALRSTLSHPS